MDGDPNGTRNERRSSINDISLRQAEKDLNVDRKVLRGVMVGLDIPVNQSGRSIRISPRDMRRLRRKIDRNYRRPAPPTAPADPSIN